MDRQKSRIEMLLESTTRLQEMLQEFRSQREDKVFVQRIEAVQKMIFKAEMQVIKMKEEKRALEAAKVQQGPKALMQFFAESVTAIFKVAQGIDKRLLLLDRLHRENKALEDQMEMKTLQLLLNVVDRIDRLAEAVGVFEIPKLEAGSGTREQEIQGIKSEESREESKKAASKKSKKKAKGKQQEKAKPEAKPKEGTKPKKAGEEPKKRPMTLKKNEAVFQYILNAQKRTFKAEPYLKALDGLKNRNLAAVPINRTVKEQRMHRMPIFENSNPFDVNRTDFVRQFVDRFDSNRMILDPIHQKLFKRMMNLPSARSTPNAAQMAGYWKDVTMPTNVFLEICEQSTFAVSRALDIGPAAGCSMIEIMFHWISFVLAELLHSIGCKPTAYSEAQLEMMSMVPAIALIRCVKAACAHGLGCKTKAVVKPRHANLLRKIRQERYARVIWLLQGLHEAKLVTFANVTFMTTSLMRTTAEMKAPIWEMNTILKTLNGLKTDLRRAAAEKDD
ncbi:hypothetical protein L596_009560 [Steinernema carpocapsae]|uniref:Uncharacterized protein n=1 Tax=Steinernema carpocapsae TaxID=34508 RepID=A0A4U5PFQ8_STECR|nr:hypothetical protein L596_009560 [Steinernema carpocapsae]